MSGRRERRITTCAAPSLELFPVARPLQAKESSKSCPASKTPLLQTKPTPRSLLPTVVSKPSKSVLSLSLDKQHHLVYSSHYAFTICFWTPARHDGGHFRTPVFLDRVPGHYRSHRISPQPATSSPRVGRANGAAGSSLRYPISVAPCPLEEGRALCIPTRHER